ncbi:MAG: DUF6612 family protein [Blautia sp.]|jgi:hypothetical protein
MKKRTVMASAGFCLLVSVMLGGCGKVTAEKLLADAAKNAKEASSVKGDMEMNMGMKVGEGGFSMGIDMGMSGDWEATNEPAVFHLDGKLDLSLLNMSFDMESYTVREDKKAVSYTKVADTWSKTEQELNDEEVKAAGLLPVFSTDAELVLAEETEKVNGQEAYVITTVLTGDELKKMMESNSELLDMDEIDMDKADFSEVSADVTIKIYEKSKLPAAMTVTFTDGLEGLIKAEDDGSAAELNKLDVSMNFNEYDTIDKIEVPKEALEAKDVTAGKNILEGALGQGSDAGTGEKPDEEVTDLLGDQEEKETADASDAVSGVAKTDSGAYVLTDYEKDVQVEVKVPENFQTDDAYNSDTNLSFLYAAEDENVNASISYSIQELSEYYTEDMVYSYLEQNKKFYEEDDNYSNVQYQPPMDLKIGGRDVKYAGMSYEFSNGSFKNMEQRFWTKIDDRHLLECQMYETVYGTEASFAFGQEYGEQVLSAVSL